MEVEADLARFDDRNRLIDSAKMASSEQNVPHATSQHGEPSTIVPPPPPPGPGQGWTANPALAAMPVQAIAGRATNRWAMVSVVMGAISYLGHVIPVVGGATVAIIAIISGFVALSQIRRSGEGGGGAATVGIVLGVANLILTLLIVVLFLVVIGGSVFDKLLHG